MRIDDIIWLDAIVEKLAVKHAVQPEEVEEVLFNTEDIPKIQFSRTGNRPGEDVYVALGRTNAGRYLSVAFIYKPSTFEALILSARDMEKNERRQYGRK